MRREIYLLILIYMSGCAGPMTQYYVLNTTSPNHKNIVAKPAQQELGGEAVIQSLAIQESVFQQVAIQQIAIRQLEIPRYLDRPRIVSRDADNHLRISEYHQWGGRLRDDITRTLSDNLAERLPLMTVHTAPFSGAMHVDLSLVIDIRQFELLADGHMHLKVRWYVQQLGRRSAGRLEDKAEQNAEQHSLSYFDHIVGENQVDDRDYAGMAAAMSHALALLSEKMVSVIMHFSDLEKQDALPL